MMRTAVPGMIAVALAVAWTGRPAIANFLAAPPFKGDPLLMLGVLGVGGGVLGVVTYLAHRAIPHFLLNAATRKVIRWCRRNRTRCPARSLSALFLACTGERQVKRDLRRYESEGEKSGGARLALRRWSDDVHALYGIAWGLLALVLACQWHESDWPLGWLRASGVAFIFAIYADVRETWYELVLDELEGGRPSPFKAQDRKDRPSAS